MRTAEGNKDSMVDGRWSRWGLGAVLMVVLPWPATLGGCWLVTTRREGKALGKRIDAVTHRLDELHAREEQVRKSIVRSRQEQKKLADLMEQAKKLFLRNSADVGAKVERLLVQIGAVLGRLDSLEKDVAAGKADRKALTKKVTMLRMDLAALRSQVVGVLKQLAARAKAPRTADEIYKAAKQKMALADYSGAVKYLRLLIKRFPTDQRLDEAAFLLGQAYFRQNKFAAAQYSFKKYLQAYPKGTYVVRAWLNQARCYYRLKYCRGALKILGNFLRRFRKGPETAEAKALRLKIRRQLRNIRYCEQ